MKIEKADIELLNKQRDDLKIPSTREFSFIAFYDKTTGIFEDFSVVNSVGDTSVTTRMELSTEEMLYVLAKMEENPNLVQVWGHSHNNMGVSPSGQDISTMKDLGHGGVGVIINNSLEYTIMLNVHGTIFRETFTEHKKYTSYAGGYWSNRTWNPKTKRWELKGQQAKIVTYGGKKGKKKKIHNDNANKSSNYNDFTSYWDDFYYGEPINKQEQARRAYNSQTKVDTIDDYWGVYDDEEQEIEELTFLEEVPATEPEIVAMTDEQLEEYLIATGEISYTHHDMSEE